MSYLLLGAAAFIFVGMAATSAFGSTVNYPVDGGAQSKFADAIAHAEGFYDEGSRPARNNNPGDFENWPGVPTDGAGYSVFGSVADGWNALEEQLNAIRNAASRHYTTGMSFRQMGYIYADGAHDPAGAANWSSNVSAFMGAGVDDAIGGYL